MRLILARDSTDPTTWETHDGVTHLPTLLRILLPVWPSSARLYRDEIAMSTDITPQDENGVEALAELPQDGTVFCIVYPQEPLTIVTLVITVASAVYSFIQQSNLPKIPGAGRTSTQPSPNNELAQRENTPRPNGRIPDIFGTVRAVPDLIAVPYSRFEDHVEVEYALMCIGRGAYTVLDVRDDLTDTDQIDEMDVNLFQPYADLSSKTPSPTIIGQLINEPVYEVKRSNSVNGQTLAPKDNAQLNGDGKFTFSYDAVTGYGEIRYYEAFWEWFAVGDVVDLTETIVAGGVNGTYTVADISPDLDVFVIRLANAAVVNPNWGAMSGDYPDEPGVLTKQGDFIYIGPFKIGQPGMTKALFNFVALNGLWRDDGINQYAISVLINISAQAVDSTGAPVSSPVVHTVTMNGSATEKSTRAITYEMALPTYTNAVAWEFTLNRVSLTSELEGNIQDEVKWRDLYAVSPVPNATFGDVTLLQTRTPATSGSLAIKKRKLNTLVQRHVGSISGSTWSATLAPSNDAANIAAHIALDPYIGRRTQGEVDFANLRSTVDLVTSTFGNAQSVEFCATFDDQALSFEQAIQSVASAAFCTASRRGNIIEFGFERAGQLPALLFNHRNKLPGSEKRTVTFGNQNGYDGVELTYIDPDDDTEKTYYLPLDQSATNPMRVETVGVRNRLQAHFHAWRAWQRIQYQNWALEFEATAEANLLARNDVILVADNTRTGTQDGEVIAQSGLTLTLSQPVSLTGGEVIWLQYSNGTTGSIGITAGATDREVLLAAAPAVPLSLDADHYARAGYTITRGTDVHPREFLVAEKSPQSNFSVNLRAVNYAPQVYAHDTDYINGVVDADGNIL